MTEESLCTPRQCGWDLRNADGRQGRRHRLADAEPAHGAECNEPHDDARTAALLRRAVYRSLRAGRDHDRRGARILRGTRSEGRPRRRRVGPGRGTARAAARQRDRDADAARAAADHRADQRAGERRRIRAGAGVGHPHRRAGGADECGVHPHRPDRVRCRRVVFPAAAGRYGVGVRIVVDRPIPRCGARAARRFGVAGRCAGRTGSRRAARWRTRFSATRRSASG